MAAKDHKLDKPIVDAAFKEFLEKGFDKASLRIIASNANVTVGALYTRYRSKDDMFIALVRPLIEKISDVFTSSTIEYNDITFTNAQSLEIAMQHESEAILHILFDDYSRSVLLLCKADHSSLASFIDELIEHKTSETIRYFNSQKCFKPDPNLVRFIIKFEFKIFREILEKGYELEEAKKIVAGVLQYNLGGWIRLLNNAQKEHAYEI